MLQVLTSDIGINCFRPNSPETDVDHPLGFAGEDLAARARPIAERQRFFIAGSTVIDAAKPIALPLAEGRSLQPYLARQESFLARRHSRRFHGQPAAMGRIAAPG